MILLPTILSGGSGSRLWPLSRELSPKPFLQLPTGNSLLQETYLRALSIEAATEVFFVTSENLFSKTQDEISNLPGNSNTRLIIEPIAKNTAAAIAAAVIVAEKLYGGDAILLVMPADHVIRNQDVFLKAVTNAIQVAGQNKLVIFGVEPTSAETGYGYIRVDGQNVIQFIEKPTIEKATEYFESETHYWNTGLCCFKAGVMIGEMELYCPDILENVRASLIEKTIYQSPNVEFSSDAYGLVREDSLDFAILEKSKKVACVVSQMDWTDVGSWVTFGELLKTDDDHNHVQGDSILSNVKNSIIYSSGGRVLALVGLDDIVVVDTDDACLVASKSSIQDVKNVYRNLKELDHSSHLIHTQVRRSWGSYTVLEKGYHFKVKRILVNPKSKISLQKHQHRSEHWVVVSGLAEVVNDGEKFFLHENQSTFIAQGHVHQLINPGNRVLEVIEVQSGPYLEEDDIVRYEDV